MAEKLFKPRDMWFTPAESSVLSVQYYDSIAANPGMRWDIPALDVSMLPWRPGTLVGIIARPGAGKTTLMAAKARITAKQIVAEGRADKECVVYVSLDQSVEEIEALFMAGDGLTATDFMRTRVGREVVVGRALERPALPIYVMGRSAIRRRPVPRFTVERIYQGIAALEEEYGVHPRLVLIDYLQIVPVEKAKERVEQVGEAVVRGGELALMLGCCVVFGAQATQGVDGRDDRIPAIGDCAWSGALGQEADVILAAARPWLWEKNRNPADPKRISVRGVEYEVEPSLFLLRAEKQRFESAGMTFVLRLTPELVRLAEHEAYVAAAAQARDRGQQARLGGLA